MQYQYTFGRQTTTLSPANLQANVLVQYQHVVQKYGRCKKKTFQDCVDKYASGIKYSDRCLVPDSSCDPSEK